MGRGYSPSPLKAPPHSLSEEAQAVMTSLILLSISRSRAVEAGLRIVSFLFLYDEVDEGPGGLGW